MPMEAWIQTNLLPRPHATASLVRCHLASCLPAATTCATLWPAALPHRALDGVGVELGSHWSPAALDRRQNDLGS